MNIIYLAGPMSGMPDLNRPVFAEAARNLRYQGYKVVSPHELNHNRPLADVGRDRAYEDYIWLDTAQGLIRCDTLVLLPGWVYSRGAKDEFGMASAWGYAIGFWDVHRETIVWMYDFTETSAFKPGKLL